MIKLIATDVDGTLVKDGTMTINPEYMTVIRKLTELGITFVVCSGRQYDSERKLFEPVKDLVYFVSDGGLCDPAVALPGPSDDCQLPVGRFVALWSLP